MLGDAEIAGGDGDVLAPVVRVDVEAVVDRCAAEQTEVVSEGVAGPSPGLGDGEGGEVPPAVPVAPVEVLVAGAQGTASHGGQRPEALVGGAVLGPLPGALAHEEALADEAAQAGPHLFGGAVAGLGDGERVGGGDRAVVPGDAEHEHARREVADADHGRRPVGGGDRARPRPARSRSGRSFPPRPRVKTTGSAVSIGMQVGDRSPARAEERRYVRPHAPWGRGMTEGHGM